MSELINKELLDACQAFLDAAPSEGHRCLYCDARVYGMNDTDEHSPDCEMVKGYAAVMKANEKMVADEQPDAPEALADALYQLQIRANRAVRAAGLKGDEFHPLNTIDVGLFGMLLVARQAAGKFPKVDEKGNVINNKREG